MSNYLTIKRVYAIDPPLDVMSSMLEDEYLKVEWGGIFNNNWAAEYPYAPFAKFWIAHNNDTLFLKFKVEEQVTKAEISQDGGAVWTDSCVEFFISFDDSGYYNFEFSCIGKKLLGFRKSKEDAQHASQEVLDSIKCYSTLGSECFAERSGEFTWDLTVAIPKQAFFAHDFKNLDNLFAMANAYKCGDGLSKPHYLSWNPIKSEKPNFHLPQYFGRMKFL